MPCNGTYVIIENDLVIDVTWLQFFAGISTSFEYLHIFLLSFEGNHALSRE